MRNLKISIVLGSLFCAAPALAWNGFGHMTVAAIAYDKLTPSTQKKVTALLKLNPAYPDWGGNTSAEDRDRIAFISAATWPDAIKDKHSGYADERRQP